MGTTTRMSAITRIVATNCSRSTWVQLPGCLPSPVSLPQTAQGVQLYNGRNQPQQPSGCSLSLPLNLEESRLLSHAKILIQPQNSLAQEQPQWELLDQELVSAQYSAPSLLVMQETHRLNNNFSHTLF